MQFDWADLPDNELLKMRICDLHVRIEGSELEERVQQLHNELEARGLPVRPDCYLSYEWFSPEGSPVIAIPFYLAHPRLKQLELHQMLEVEGGTEEWCMQILRHECGHAYDHAYQFSSTDAWVEVFGNRDVEYQPETYRPAPVQQELRPASAQLVRTSSSRRRFRRNLRRLADLAGLKSGVRNIAVGKPSRSSSLWMQ